MSSLKSHITLIMSLVSILISIFFFKIFNTVLNEYQHNIVHNYSIVIVSDKEITSPPIKAAESIEKIDISAQLKEIQKKFKNINLSNIQMPYFYKLKLKTLPSPEKLKEIEDYLKSYPNIKRVLTYKSSQTKIYNLLNLLKILSNISMIIISVIGFLLIVKQLEVWKLEHNQRMYIMELFGAPFWFRGAALFKIALIDSLIALIITTALIYYFRHSLLFTSIINDLHISVNINLFKNVVELFLLSVFISLFSTIIIVIGNKK